jgi:DNA-binding GntR family transcriptional regulator
LPSKNSVEQILEPVRVNTVQEDVYQQLFSAIISGRIPPGERLVSHRLAKQMNVSRAPVREALRLLQAAGLVSSPQKKGSLAYELSKENLKEISGLRIMLEVSAGELAALNCDTEILHALETLLIGRLNKL